MVIIALKGVDTLLGKIMGIDKTYAFISLEDGSTVDINKAYLPIESKIGDKVNIQPDINKIKNNTIPEIFF